MTLSLSVKGLRAIVTAGAAGIGRETAATLIAAGAKVHICDVDEKAMAEAGKALPGLGVTRCDVSKPAEVDRLFAEAAGALGGLDLLVNNAGIAGPTAPVEDIEPADWDRTLAINITGQFLCARRAVPLLKKNRGGAIVNLSSAAGVFGYPLRLPYAASKWAVVGLTKTLAMELGEHKIRVNAICPGIVEGPRIDRVIGAKAEARGMSLAAMREQYLKMTSLRSTVSAKDIANMILYLASAAGRTITGQALSVDAGVESLRA